MSPELIKGGTEGHDFSVDWWSVGVLTYELLTGASPFTVDGERNTQAEISKRILRNQPPIPEHLSPEAADFIRRLLVKEPTKRLGGGQGDASQLKHHPFLSKINWTLLAQRKLKPPFKPKIKHELDVSNFAEEFTSMPPHALVASSNNHISASPTANQLTTARDNEEDDYYESSDSYEEDFNEDDESLVSSSSSSSSSSDYSESISTSSFYRDNISNRNHHQSSDKFITGGNSLERESNPIVENNILTCANRSVYVRDKPRETASEYYNNQNQQKSKNHHQPKAFLSSISIENDSVIQSSSSERSGVSTEGSRCSGISSNNSITGGQLGINCSQHIISMLTPSKHQLSFSMLAKQRSHLFEANRLKQQSSLSSFIPEDTSKKNSCEINYGSSASYSLQSLRRSPESKQSQPKEKGNGNVHFSKLFKGYSYINPHEVDWLKQQDKKLKKIRDGKLSGVNQSILSRDSNEFSAQPTLPPSLTNKPSQIESTSAARAVPVEDVSLIDDELDSKLFDDRQESTRAIFTIGDGEDLATAIKSASRSQPERLIVVKRKPSLEVLYECHANKQNLLVTMDKNKADTINAGSDPKAPKLGSILFDPQCDFFKHYFLPNPINSKKDLLGVGAYSICKRCVHTDTGKEYAVKIMDQLNPSTSNEIDILISCQGHPNIVKLYNVYHDKFNTYLVCELLKGGELLSRIRSPTISSNYKTSRRQLTNERDICRIFKSIVSTVNYLHSLRIVHRDLKPENLLFVDSSSESEVKLIDFGFARKLPEDELGTMKSPCSTLDYCAPEVLNQCFQDSRGKKIKLFNSVRPNVAGTTQTNNEKDGYNESCDLWSLGVILYAMLSGQLPFKKTEFPQKLSDFVDISPLNPIDSREDNCFTNDKRQKLFPPSDNVWKSVSEAAKDVIVGLLNPNPERRLTIGQLMQHQWFEKILTPERNRDAQVQDMVQMTPKRKSSPSSSGNQKVAPITMTLRKVVEMVPYTSETERWTVLAAMAPQQQEQQHQPQPYQQQRRRRQPPRSAPPNLPTDRCSAKRQCGDFNRASDSGTRWVCPK